jgi:hypothetical protein
MSELRSPNEFFLIEADFPDAILALGFLKAVLLSPGL